MCAKNNSVFLNIFFVTERSEQKLFFYFFNFFSKKGIDFSLNVMYYNQAVARERLANKKCRSGGIGRRAGFRCLWSQDRVGSSPISCIIFLLFRETT